MGELHRALVGVSSAVDPHLVVQKKISKFLYRTTNVQDASPVFLVKNQNRQELVMVYSLRTNLDIKDFFMNLEKNEASKFQGAELRLLLFDDVVLRTPNVVVPWVDLSVLKKWCHPSVYLWPDYIHPIEGKSLKVIGSEIQTTEEIEFYLQSKSVLDFLNVET